MTATILDAYYVVEDFGRLGRSTVINWEACSKRDVIDALIRGEVERPLEVHCIDREGKTWTDVSDEIAQEIIDQIDHEPTGGLFDFCEQHLGCQTMTELSRERAFV